MYLTCVTATCLLQLVVRSLGEEPRRGKERLFLQILDKTKEAEGTTLLIIDEAHLLEPQALTDLRLLVTSTMDDGEPSLKILLSGQERLRDQLKRSDHADLAHRINVRFHMQPPTAEQTASSSDFQMNSAGASDKVFEPESKKLAHETMDEFRLP